MKLSWAFSQVWRTTVSNSHNLVDSFLLMMLFSMRDVGVMGVTYPCCRHRTPFPVITHLTHREVANSHALNPLRIRQWWRVSAYCHDPRQLSFVRPSQNDRLVYLGNFFTLITKFYKDIHTDLVYIPTRYDVISYFRSEVIAQKLSKMLPVATLGRIS